MGRKRIKAFFLCCCLVAFLSWGKSSALQEPQEKKTAFPDFQLPVPSTADEKTYLGVSGTGEFSIKDVKSRVLIIEIFSNFCPHCVKEAPKVNELYRALEKGTGTKGKIKVIGIGAGNDASEVKKFKETHAIPFPLFPDKYFSIGGPLGVLSTPTFIGVCIDEDHTIREFYRKSGNFGEVDEFISQVLTLSGL